jgi:hypothetical protein
LHDFYFKAPFEWLAVDAPFSNIWQEMQFIIGFMYDFLIDISNYSDIIGFVLIKNKEQKRIVGQ